MSFKHLVILDSPQDFCIYTLSIMKYKLSSQSSIFVMGIILKFLGLADGWKQISLFPVFPPFSWISATE